MNNNEDKIVIISLFFSHSAIQPFSKQTFNWNILCYSLTIKNYMPLFIRIYILLKGKLNEKNI